MPVLSCLRPAADAPVAMEDEDEYPTARRARAFSRIVDAPAHDNHTYKRYNLGKDQTQAVGRRGEGVCEGVPGSTQERSRERAA